MPTVIDTDSAPKDLMVNMLREARYGTISTSWQDDNIPTKVAIAVGKLSDGCQYALFWISSPEAEHSQHLENNPICGMAVGDENAEQGTGFGFRFRGKAKKLEDFGTETKVAFDTLKKKFIKFPETWEQINEKDSLRKIYMLVVERVQINAADEFKDKAGWKDYSTESDAHWDILKQACAPS